MCRHVFDGWAVKLRVHSVTGSSAAPECHRIMAIQRQRQTASISNYRYLLCAENFSPVRPGSKSGTQPQKSPHNCRLEYDLVLTRVWQRTRQFRMLLPVLRVRHPALVMLVRLFYQRMVSENANPAVLILVKAASYILQFQQ